MSTPNPVNLLDFDVNSLVAWFAGLGEKPVPRPPGDALDASRGCDDFDAMTDVAKSLRAKLKDLAVIRPPVPVRDRSRPTARAKWLLDVGNANAVETVFIPDQPRHCACPRQAGCALDCAFCSPASGASTATCRPPKSSASSGWPTSSRRGAGRRRGTPRTSQGRRGQRPHHQQRGDDGRGANRSPTSLTSSPRCASCSTTTPTACRAAGSVSIPLPASCRRWTACATMSGGAGGVAACLNDALRDRLVPINPEIPAAQARRLPALPRRAPRDFRHLRVRDAPEASKRATRTLANSSRWCAARRCKFNLVRWPLPGLRRSLARGRIRRFAGILIDAGIVTTTRRPVATMSTLRAASSPARSGQDAAYHAPASTEGEHAVKSTLAPVVAGGGARARRLRGCPAYPPGRPRSAGRCRHQPATPTPTP